MKIRKLKLKNLGSDRVRIPNELISWVTAYEAGVTEGEVYMSMLGLVKFSHLVAENWATL
jgi:hypothetical protein